MSVSTINIVIYVEKKKIENQFAGINGIGICAYSTNARDETMKLLLLEEIHLPPHDSDFFIDEDNQSSKKEWDIPSNYLRANPGNGFTDIGTAMSLFCGAFKKLKIDNEKIQVYIDIENTIMIDHYLCTHVKKTLGYLFPTKKVHWDDMYRYTNTPPIKERKYTGFMVDSIVYHPWSILDETKFIADNIHQKTACPKHPIAPATFSVR